MTTHLVKRGPVGLVIPDERRGNAYTPDSVDDLALTLRIVLSDPAYKSLVIAGARSGILAGASLEVLAAKDHSEVKLEDQWSAFTAEQKANMCAEGLYSALTQVSNSEKPSLAYIKKAAIGGGLEIALACDQIYIHPDAKVSFPELSLELFPAAGGIPNLMRRVGAHKAMEILAQGRVYNANEALELGIVDVVSDALPKPAAITKRVWTPREDALLDIDATLQKYGNTDPVAIVAIAVQSYQEQRPEDAQLFLRQRLIEQYEKPEVIAKLRSMLANQRPRL